MNTSRISRSIILITASLVSGQVLWAQDTGHLKGRVTDSEGAAIEGTRIIVKSPMTQLETAANESGEFDIELPVGMYRIETSKMPGFVPFKRSRVKIRADKGTVQNIRLKVTSDDAICILIITAHANKAKPAAKNNRNQ
jgi:carboxypeptidase family protein